MMNLREASLGRIQEQSGALRCPKVRALIESINNDFVLIAGSQGRAESALPAANGFGGVCARNSLQFSSR